jgi:hypothetical protein
MVVEAQNKAALDAGEMLGEPRKGLRFEDA